MWKLADLDLTVFSKKRINSCLAGQVLRISISIMMNHLEHKNISCH